VDERDFGAHLWIVRSPLIHLTTVPEMAYVYILRCADGSFYTGSTTDLEARLAQHQNGEGAIYTRERLPVELVWFSGFERVADAFGWEKRIQGWSRAKKQLLIDGRYDECRAGVVGREGADRAPRFVSLRSLSGREG